MKIFIITNIRSGGTAFIAYLSTLSIKTLDDPQNNIAITTSKIDEYYQTHDCIKLSISSFAAEEYIDILNHIVTTHSPKIYLLIRNNLLCALSILKTKETNKYTSGYKLSYDLTLDVNIKPFTIPFENVEHEALKIENKYTKIKNYLTKKNINYYIIYFEQLFNNNDSIEKKYTKILPIYNYVNKTISYIDFKKTPYLYTESEHIYDKYCINHKELINKITLQ
jgi:hypothetical protein